jgi:hypothetical protein
MREPKVSGKNIAILLQAIAGLCDAMKYYERGDRETADRKRKGAEHDILERIEYVDAGE